MDVAADGSRCASGRIWNLLYQKHGPAVSSTAGKPTVWADSDGVLRTAVTTVSCCARSVPIFPGVLPTVCRPVATDPHHVCGEFPCADCARVQPESPNRNTAGPGSGSRV